MTAALSAFEAALIARTVTVTRATVLKLCKEKRGSVGEKVWKDSVAMKRSVGALLAVFRRHGEGPAQEIVRRHAWELLMREPVLVAWKPGFAMYLGRVVAYGGDGDGGEERDADEGPASTSAGPEDRTGKHKIEFVDGDVEWHDLRRDQYMVLEKGGTVMERGGAAAAAEAAEGKEREPEKGGRNHLGNIREVAEAAIAGDVNEMCGLIRANNDSYNSPGEKHGSVEESMQATLTACVLMSIVSSTVVNRGLVETGGCMTLPCEWMERFEDSPMVQVSSCRALLCMSNVRQDSPVDRVRRIGTIVAAGALRLALGAMERFLDNPDVQWAACEMLQSVCHENDVVKEHITAVGGIEAAALAMRSFPEHIEIQRQGTWVMLKVVHTRPDRVARARECGVVELLRHAAAMGMQRAETQLINMKEGSIVA